MRSHQSPNEVYERNRAMTERAMRLARPSRAAMRTGLQARYQPMPLAPNFASSQPRRSASYDAAGTMQAVNQPELLFDFRDAVRRRFFWCGRCFDWRPEPLVVSPSPATLISADAREMTNPWVSVRAPLGRVGSMPVFAYARGTSYAVPDAVTRAAMAASAFADPTTAALATRASLMEPGALSGFLRHLEGRGRPRFTELHASSHRVASWLEFLRPELDRCAPDEVVKALRWARALHRRFVRRLSGRPHFTAQRTTTSEIASVVMTHGPPVAFAVPRRPTGASGCW